MNAKKMLFAGACLLAACFTQAQESQMPKAFSYQAVVRNSQGKVIAQQSVGIKVEILQGSTEGAVVYAETQTPESSQTGTVNLLIGTGTVTEGTFADIDWGAATYFLRISMDVQGGSSYEVVSTTQMLPVPYALYAEKAGSVVNEESEETEPETPATPENNQPLFSLVPLYNGSYPMDLMKALTNKTVVLDNWSFLVFYMQYLTGTDLQLSAEIEGCEVDSEQSSESTEYGRVYTFKNPTVETTDEISTQLIIKDKDGNILKSYPFKYKRINQ